MPLAICVRLFSHSAVSCGLVKVSGRTHTRLIPSFVGSSCLQMCIRDSSYTSEDSDLVAVENNYAALENGLQSEIDNIESTHPGYDEYRYDLDSSGHNPHELASYLTALLQSYTCLLYTSRCV